VICANLIYDLLLEAQPRLLGLLAPGGTLVLAGVLRSQFAKVRRAYTLTGLKLVTQFAEKEWKSGAFRGAA
jgi:ribosomal protein L11 methyltransferase